MFFDVYWLFVQCVYLTLGVYVVITLYGFATTAHRVLRIRRVLQKHFDGDSGSFMLGTLLELAENSHRLFDVSISKNNAMVNV